MERFDICDEFGMPTGETVSREEAHEKGILHRTAHIWITKQDGPVTFVLLQKRAQNKDSFPGCFDTSSAGHIQAGDEPIDSALRELQEELGIQADKKDLHFIGTFRIQYQEEFHGKTFRDNEVAFTYLYEEPVEISQLTLQKEELDSVMWHGLDSTYLAILQENPDFCVPAGGINMVRRHYYPHCTHPKVLEAKKEIDHILKKYGPNCQIAFLRRIAIIIDSYKVHSKEDRHRICKMIAELGLSERSHENLSAEWEVHNVAYQTHVGRSHAKDVDLDYDQDPRFMVRLATNLFDLLNIE